MHSDRSDHKNSSDHSESTDDQSEPNITPFEEGIWTGYDAMDHALQNLSDLTSSLFNFIAVERNEGPISLIRDQLATLQVKRAVHIEQKERLGAVANLQTIRSVSESEQESDSKTESLQVASSETPATTSSWQGKHRRTLTLPKVLTVSNSSSWRHGFRLFELQPDQEKGSVEGRILKYELSEDLPPFEALSYFWGAEDHIQKVTVRSENTSYQQTVRIGLLSALRRLRFSDRPRLLWIDRFCLDWDTIEILNLQVSQMGQIFRAAEKACVWLGDASDDSDRAFSFMGQILELDRMAENTDWSRHREDWNALLSFIERPWFSRIWVIQELAFSREATMYCGTEEMSWSDLADVIALTSEMIDDASSFRNSTDSAGMVEWGDLSPEGFANMFKHSYAKKLEQFHCNIFRPSANGTANEPLLSLETLVCLMSPFQYSLGRDAVYAAVALANDVSSMLQVGRNPDEAARRISRPLTMPPAFPIDAKKPTVEVFVDFIKHTLWTSGSANILLYPWAPDHPGLPSWITSRRDVSHARSSRGIYYRVRADRLLASSLSSHTSSRTYSACGKLSVSFEIDPWSHLTIGISGFVLDHVHRKALPAQSGVIPQSWPSFAGWTNRAHAAPEPFWRLLVGDRDTNGNRAPTFFPRACTAAFQRIPEGADLDTARFIRSGAPKMLRHFLDRVQAVTWGKRLIKTSSGSLGIAPVQTKNNDLVCILHGCDIPVILRRTGQPTQEQLAFRPPEELDFLPSEDFQAEMVGECFLHGYMSGEALAYQERNAIPTVRFTLR